MVNDVSQDSFRRNRPNPDCQCKDRGRSYAVINLIVAWQRKLPAMRSWRSVLHQVPTVTVCALLELTPLIFHEGA